MLIGVVSDSHDNLGAVRAAARTLSNKGVEVVLHLGDVVAPFTLKAFKEGGVNRLVAVYGNNCGERLGLRRVASELGYQIHEWPYVLELEGKRVAMLHGVGPKRDTLELVEALAASGRYDAVLYGHTHEADVRKLGGTLILNPGELCGCLTGKRTFAILDLERGEVELVEI
ncbi:MAG: metallophosphoesterase, partial [Thermoproteota archaeon]